MILGAIIWICTLAACHCRIITINNEGNNSTDCCTYGSCPCSSFIDALKFMKDNTTIQITLHLVTLDSNVTMGSGSLNNITIQGNGAVVMCNNKGSVACRSCSNVIFEEITWDRCANSKFTQGIGFLNAVNVTMYMCTFQHFNTCMGVVFFNITGFIIVQRCHFLFNHLGNVSDYPAYAALAFLNNIERSSADTIEVYIIETQFHHNGIFDQSERNYSTIQIILSRLSTISLYVDNSTISESGGLGGYFFLQNANKIVVVLNETIFTHNNRGGSEVTVANVRPVPNKVLISSSTFAYNINGSLKLRMVTLSLFGDYTEVLLYSLTIVGNKGTFGKDSIIGSNSFGQGTGILLWFNSLKPQIKIAYCNIHNNIGGDSSIVYIEDGNTGTGFIRSGKSVKIISSNFTNNSGPTLYLSNCNIRLKGYLSFSNNTAQSGSAIYFTHNSQASIGGNSLLEFTDNIALLYGGAIYVDLPMNCLHQGITFTYLPYNSLVLFTNNSAGIAGNSLYFSIPESCSIIRNHSKDNSIVYIPYYFTYIQLPDSSIPEISTSPYAVNLCSKECRTTNLNNCFIGKGDMLGQSINFNATACDYYNNVSKSVQFIAECINCNSSYRLSDNKILIHNGVSDFAVNGNSDISTSRNITINMTSISSHGYKQLSAVVSAELSPCHSGYIFDTNSQHCKCYDRDQDVIQCQQNYVEIKYGYWFGTVTSGIHTFSLCPTYYCEFGEQAETRNGFFNLQSDQCSSHRTGMACGECKSGYTLAYDSPDCINENKCSAGMAALVVILTILYWIIVVVVVFGLMYFNMNISLGYVNGILFYYSIVDILLGSNLYISVGVFQLTTILSSFAKLTPQFLGKLCFVQGLSGIDQQFIHYAHALAVFLLTILISIIARKWSGKIASIVSHCIIRVVCLLLLLAYTSLASTSFQLLRPLHYHDINDLYVYLSPSIKYFTNRHVVYGIIAWAFGLVIVIGFPLLLFFQPFLRSKINFIKIKPLLDQFQGCYKDQYHWFAAYYFICRLIIIAVAFANNALYYLQTASIIIVMIHLWIQPYKSDTILNMLDGIILLTMVLIINLGSYTFITSTTTTLVIVFVIFPICLSLVIFFYFLFLSKRINHILNSINEARYAIFGTYVTVQTKTMQPIIYFTSSD